jgi:iron complex outermembrane receptor protein
MRALRAAALISLTAWLVTGPIVSALPRQEQEQGRIEGRVTLESTSEPLHGARILIVQISRSALSASDGTYFFDGVPPGTYEVFAVREHLQAVRSEVTVRAGETTRFDFVLTLQPVHEQVTVTASGRETSVQDTFSSVQVMDSIEVARRMAGSLGELLEQEPGVAKRSFGPGSSRPIIRGFDNDRVLITQDGVRTGDLSSQSGDHGTSLDPGSVQRVEVIKGPATLLYGSNAIGGVVNTLSPQEQYYDDPVDELRGQVNLDLGSTNEQAGGNGNFQFGNGRWMGWLGGGARRTSDYDTPEGPVENSATELQNARAGGGWFGDKAYFSLNYQREHSVYGVPYAGDLHGHEEDHVERSAPRSLTLAAEDEHGEEELLIDIDGRRQSLRANAGLRNLEGSFIDSVRGSFSWTDWNHKEIENFVDSGTTAVGTTFDNTNYIGRLEAVQSPLGRLEGQFGVWGQHRDYVASGEEALAPPTRQNSLAGFAYEEYDLGGPAVQFGARVEYNGYDPDARPEIAGHDGHGHGDEVPAVRDRDFTGLSGSIGLRVPFAEQRGTAVVNLSSSYRAPALEELYNYGPHVGNLAFEIGNPELGAERSNGAELIFRWSSERLHGEVAGFYYDIDDFIFGAETGEIVDGLIEIVYSQGDARFVGSDASFSFHLSPKVHLELSGSYVDAELTATGESLPRIPPLSGRASIDWSPNNQLEIEPEIFLAARQDNVYGVETPTDGYALLNLMASYTIARAKTMHVISLRATNLTNELYRNHTSLIKDLAPEMGRRILLTYALRLF